MAVGSHQSSEKCPSWPTCYRRGCCRGHQDRLSEVRMITIVMVTHDRLALLKQVVNNILSASQSSGLQIELRILVNGPDAKTLSYLQSFAKDWGNIHVTAAEKPLTPAAARNSLL